MKKRVLRSISILDDIVYVHGSKLGIITGSFIIKDTEYMLINCFKSAKENDAMIISKHYFASSIARVLYSGELNDMIAKFKEINPD